MRSSVYDIARSHVHLPVYRDVGMLKKVLQDWVAYTEQTPLQQKDSFSAKLRIRVCRRHRLTSTCSPAGVDECAARNTWRKRGLGAWFESDPPQRAYGTGSEVAWHVYDKVIPLQLWTAVLPWEVQRGLSLSELRLSTETEEPGESVPAPNSVVANPTPPPEEMVCEEDDPYGVVTAPSKGVVENSSLVSPGPRARLPSSPGSAAVPGMLFLLDMQSTCEHGISFWSGAITQPIDVVFVAPTLPSALAHRSFAKLREEEKRLRISQHHISPEVVERFFPLDELRSSSVDFLVHHYGHLDPFPSVEGGAADAKGLQHGSRIKSIPVERGAAACDDTARCYTVEPPRSSNANSAPSSAASAPRYVIEMVRYTMRDSVRQAVQESEADFARRYGSSLQTSMSTSVGQTLAPSLFASTSTAAIDGSGDVQLELQLEFSDALKEDLMAKAQLDAHYVQPLATHVRAYLRQLNQPVMASVDTAQKDGMNVYPPGGTGEADRKMQVWLSETESLWMTPRELTEYRLAQMNRHNVSPSTKRHRRPNAENGQRDEVAESGDRQHASVDALDDADHGALAQVQSDSSGAFFMSTPAFVQPIQPGAVQDERRLAHRSLMLKDEDEGRPTYLAPAFTGRHDAAVFKTLGENGQLVASADKLARYPKTHSHAPQTAPIDYELFDLCLRLRLCEKEAFFHYYDRMLREWKLELKSLLAMGNGVNAAAPSSQPPGGATKVDAKDVQRMLDMVRDPALQLPEELGAVVEAVAQRRKDVQKEL